VTVIVHQSASNKVVVSQKVASVSTSSIGLQGPPGAQGPAGPAGADGLSGTYEHQQAVPSSTWVITHNLNAHPSVTVVDTSGTVWASGVNYDSPNQITITHSAPFAGSCYLN
jgi:hypothetical protein